MKKLILFVSTLMAVFSCGSKKPMAGGHGVGIDRKAINEVDEEDGHNKEAILDGPDGTSTHAFTGKQKKQDKQ